ncbi:hypothetical protein KIPB_004302 [Kipferlia bialata]|uniref:Uncharacterized protein n=1 Tax=Kipferlia bialata TaxID=797122 RepID=A0A9K3GGH5_9EUKA|nr:hypothetical protein KIPB_004302 [Kipferlia bialata]|eukprot:g4302.t1
MTHFSLLDSSVGEGETAALQPLGALAVRLSTHMSQIESYRRDHPLPFSPHAWDYPRGFATTLKRVVDPIETDLEAAEDMSPGDPDMVYVATHYSTLDEGLMFLYDLQKHIDSFRCGVANTTYV